MKQLSHIGLDVHKDAIAVAVLRPGRRCRRANDPQHTGGNTTAATPLRRPLCAAVWPVSFIGYSTPEEAGDRGRNYATVTTMFPNFCPVSAYR